MQRSAINKASVYLMNNHALLIQKSHEKLHNSGYLALSLGPKISEEMRINELEEDLFHTRRNGDKECDKLTQQISHVKLDHHLLQK